MEHFQFYWKIMLNSGRLIGNKIVRKNGKIPLPVRTWRNGSGKRIPKVQRV